MKVNFYSNYYPKYSNIKFKGLFGFDGSDNKDSNKGASQDANINTNTKVKNILDNFFDVGAIASGAFSNSYNSANSYGVSNPEKDNDECIYRISPFSYIYPNLGFWVSGTSFEKPLYNKDLLPSQEKVYRALDTNKNIFDAHLEQDLGGKQELPLETYFIRMKKYKKDLLWARNMVNLTYLASDMMSHNKSFDEILSTVCLGVFYSNDKESYGILKKTATVPANVGFIMTPDKRGGEYYEKYKTRTDCQKNGEFYPNAGEYKKIANTSIVSRYCDGNIFVDYPRVTLKDSSNLEIVKEIYNDLKSKENPTRKEIVDAMAKIQWLIAQETPYLKGSDSVANILMRSIAHSYNVPISPLKEGISLDFEAFYSNLDDYVKNYPNFFETNPLEELLSNS